MDLIVTGASGFLGAYVMRLAVEQGRDALGLIHGHRMPVTGSSLSLDLTDTRAVMQVVARHRPRAIIHAAALTSPDACEKDPAAADALNVTATGALAMAAFAHNAHLTFISTDLVFDGERGMYTEEDTPNPINYYATTKAQAEHYVRMASPEFAVVRPSFIYGEPLAEHHSSYSHQLVTNLRRGVPTNVFDDQFRSPILVNALAAVALEISDARLDGIWHTGGADRVSRAEFARSLAAAAGLDPSSLQDISMDTVALPAPRPRDVSLDSSKARHRLQNSLPSLTDGFHFLFGKGG